LSAPYLAPLSDDEGSFVLLTVVLLP